jgi:hypothetical protein
MSLANRGLHLIITSDFYRREKYTKKLEYYYPSAHADKIP